MNILSIGKDPTIFETGPRVFGDTRKRHLMYARELREKSVSGGSIRFIGYSTRKKTHKVLKFNEGLELYPTNSAHRIMFIFDVLRLLPRVLRKWKPDIITTQTPWEEGTIALFLARFLGAKFLPQVHFDLFSSEWRKEHWLNGWRKMVALFLIKKADGVRVVSNKTKQDLIEKAKIDSHKIHVVPVGINFNPLSCENGKEAYKEAIEKSISHKPTVGFVGRFYSPKNLPLWVETAKLIAEMEPDVSFILAGDGVLFDETRSLIKSKGGENKFLLLGMVGHEKLPEVYAALDVFLLTSHYEGSPAVVKEALMAKVPVVSTCCIKEGDLVHSGRSGYVVSSGKASDLAEKVLLLLGNREMRAAFGQSGNQFIYSKYSIESLVKKHVLCWMETYCYERKVICH